jgi:muramoyltetrapeptide carboxypeptidase
MNQKSKNQNISRAVKPPGIRKGDLIGVISPAGAVDEADLREGLRVLETSGFRVMPGPHVLDRHGYLAGRDEDRLNDLHAMFESPDIRAVLCARGGYGTQRLLERIDYDLVRRNPKVFVGYSDITALLTAIHERTGLITFHGPMVRDLGSSQGVNLEGLIKAVTYPGQTVLSSEEATVLIPGRAAGPLIGGNLSIICHLLGTPFFPSLEGRILVVEDRGEPLYRIDRMLTHLRLSGRLDGLAGMIAGEFVECGDISAIHVLLREMLLDLEIPVVAGFPVGHGANNLTLPMGLRAELDADSMRLTFVEGALR